MTPVWPVRDAVDVRATAAVATACRRRVGQVIDIPTGPGMSGSLGGTGAVQAYQYTDSAGAPAHGVLFVHVATTGEAAGVNVFAAGQPPAMDPTGPVWNPLVNYMWVVGLSLCPPDGAGAFCFALGGP